MKYKELKTFLILSLILNSACVHTQTEEKRSVQVNADSNLSKLKVENADVDYLVYQSSQFPLGEFFFHLRKGDYSKAFHQIDLRYRPANFEDGALGELIEAGFVPVYVKIKNTGNTPMTFDEKSFSLNFTSEKVKAFYSEQLPREFKHYSPKAVAANVYNTGVVVIGFAAVMAAFIAVNVTGVSHLGDLVPATSQSTNSIYNDITKSVKVDYQKYLMSKSVLKPGEETKGLLFFHIADTALPSEAQFQFELKP